MEEKINEKLPEMEPAAKPPRRKKKVWLIILIIFLSLLLLLVAAAGGGYWWLHHTVDKNVNNSDSYSDEELDVNQKDDIINNIVDANPDVDTEGLNDRLDKVHNIALFGVDQAKGSVGRSDAMIILSIDKESQKIKMTSLARDSLVPIDGHGEEKLTHAWAYGQARLAIKTINQNFGMNITDYAYVNFGELMGVVDYIGGVQLDVDAAEMSFLNENHVYTQGFYDQTIEPLSAPGVQQLNGAQALLYARDRTNGGDTTRTARQREVLMAMYQRVREQPLSKLPSTLARVLRLCHTNMNSDELLDIATWALTANPTITSLHMPTEDMECWNGIIDRERGWVRVYDLDQAKTVLHNFIYETDTEADATVSDTSTDTTTGDTTSDPE